MPATAQTLQYADLVTADVAVDNQVNLVDYDNFGHRVQISLPAADANAALKWIRAAGSSRPVGHFDLTNSSSFTAALVTALGAGYTDIDAVTGKLSYDSTVFNTNTDSRIRESGISANDLVMAYVLYKIYGSSAITTQEKIFNLEDAHQMLTSEFLAGRITASFSAAEALSSNTTNEKGAIDAMFRDLLASDPNRFFDATGKQIPGLFETRVDSASSGSWGLIANDVLEVRVEFTFQNKVTLRTTRDVSQALTQGAGLPADANKETIIINSGDKFNIRLQLKITDGAGGGGGGGITTNISPPTLQPFVSVLAEESSPLFGNLSSLEQVAYDYHVALSSGVVADVESARELYFTESSSFESSLYDYINSGTLNDSDKPLVNEAYAREAYCETIYNTYYKILNGGTVPSPLISVWYFTIPSGTETGMVGGRVTAFETNGFKYYYSMKNNLDPTNVVNGAKNIARNNYNSLITTLNTYLATGTPNPADQAMKTAVEAKDIFLQTIFSNFYTINNGVITRI